MNIIGLVSWGGSMDEGDYYKVYGYTYDKKGNIHTNAILDNNLNLSDYNAKNNSFKYKNAISVKNTYLRIIVPSRKT